MKTSSIIITSAGRRTQLMEAFRASCRSLQISAPIVACDSNPDLSSACHLADKHYEVRRCLCEGYTQEIKDIAEKEGAKLIVPTIDTELPVLSRDFDLFKNVGIRVVVPAPNVVAIAADKLKTAEVLNKLGISTAETMTLAEWKNSKALRKVPIILKPIDGSASIGIARPRSVEEAMLVPNNGKMIVQELVQGKEYTVNAYYSQEGKLLCAVPHLRIEVRAGEVSKGRTEHVPCLEETARIMGEGIPGLRGPICFQAIVRDDGSYAVFEINARFGGGYPLAHHAGATFTKWILEETLGLPSTANNNWREGVTMLRYDSAVFLG